MSLETKNELSWSFGEAFTVSVPSSPGCVRIDMSEAWETPDGVYIVDVIVLCGVSGAGMILP